MNLPLNGYGGKINNKRNRGTELRVCSPKRLANISKSYALHELLGGITNLMCYLIGNRLWNDHTFHMNETFDF